MEEEIKQLKTVLRSLVVSSPSEMNVRTLLSDYRNMMGTHIPLQKFGYKDALTFLKERCNDCFLFTGVASNPILTLIVPDTLKHIDQFVQKQKPSSTTKHKVKRRSVPQSIIESTKPNLIVESYSQKQKQQLDKTIEPKMKPPDIDVPVNNCDANKEQVNGFDKECNKKIENVEDHIESKDNDKTISVSKCSSTALQKFLKKRTPLYDSLDSDKFNKVKECSKDENDSGRQTLSSNNSSMKSSKFEQLKTEIRDVIAEHPDGVLCTDLMRLYRERYKKELEFNRWGYTCIVSVVCALGDGVNLSRLEDTGDWLVRDARTLHNQQQQQHQRLRRLQQHYQRVAATASDHAVDVDDALPGIQYDPDVFPSDCMQFTESLLPPPLSDVQPGMLLEVMVGEVYSPSHFWLMRLGDEYHIALDDIMDEMTEYYERGEGKSRELARGAVRAGQYCVCKYERDWHRALIVRELDADTVKVRLVDYGTVEQTEWRALRPLCRRWAALPQQAWRARLAGVAPAASARHWTRAASRHLLRRVQQRHLVAHVANIDTQENIQEVFLVDTSGEEDVCLTNDLIRSGHAEPRATSSLLTSECHLYPRFEALENGAAPNFGDIERYLRDGIALQYVDDYRRHVPVDLPPTPPSPPHTTDHSTESTSPLSSTDSSPSPSSSPAPSFDLPLTRIPLLRMEAESQTSPAPSRRSPTPPPPPPVPPPPAPALPASDEVRLSLVECEMYRELYAVSPVAAHWFMMGALSRALHSSSLSVNVSDSDLTAHLPHVPHVAHVPPFVRGPSVPYPPHPPGPPFMRPHFGPGPHSQFGPPAPHPLFNPPGPRPQFGPPGPFPQFGPRGPHVMFGPPGPLMAHVGHSLPCPPPPHVPVCPPPGFERH